MMTLLERGEVFIEKLLRCSCWCREGEVRTTQDKSTARKMSVHKWLTSVAQGRWKISSPKTLYLVPVVVPP